MSDITAIVSVSGGKDSQETADGNPLLCGDPATEGPYCEEHRKVAFVRAPRARAIA
jgi:hypothetical protein